MKTKRIALKGVLKKEMKDAQEVEMKGKGGVARRAMTGACPTCGTKMVKFVK